MVYLYGLHASRAALLNPKRIIEKVWMTETIAQKEHDLLQKASFFKKHSPIIVDKRYLDNLLPEGSVHQGIVILARPLATVSLDSLKQNSAHSQIVVILDQVTDPQNIGSILRLCRAFDVSALVLTESKTPTETGAIAKVASGALEVIPRCIVSNLASAIRSLKNAGFWCVGLSEQANQSLKEIDLNGKIAIIMGSEGSGMRSLTEKLCDFKVFLPTSSQFSTLNVTTATAITLYETFTAQHPHLSSKAKA